MEWKIIPASITRTPSLEFTKLEPCECPMLVKPRAGPLSWLAELVSSTPSSERVFALGCERRMTIRIPTYSTMKERNIPAMAIAVAVDSYAIVPIHSLRNMISA